MTTTKLKQNKKAVMYAKITKHGNQLLRLWPRIQNRDPIALCKRLHSLELKVTKANEALCSLPNAQPIHDRVHLEAREYLKRLGVPEKHVILNSDPRGYALKIPGDVADRVGLQKDWGGYGIMAPDFSL